VVATFTNEASTRRASRAARHGPTRATRRRRVDPSNPGPRRPPRHKVRRSGFVRRSIDTTEGSSAISAGRVLCVMSSFIGTTSKYFTVRHPAREEEGSPGPDLYVLIRTSVPPG
jgi:hypothetical protein